MEKYIMLSIFILVWLFVSYWFGKRIFEKEVYTIYRTLHWKLIFARRRDEGSFIKAKKYLCFKNLNQDQLERLLLLVRSKIPNVNINSQMFSAIFSLSVGMVTLLFGAVFSGILGSLFSSYIQEIMSSGNKKKLSALDQSINSIFDTSAPDFICLVLLFFLGASIWGQVQIRLNETKIIIESIIEQELKRISTTNS
ncbi:hypothetical protein [Brevibacillus brevis]|uniref:Uncharacterized protein n=1 Tax=Brevibacillus brevis TaxID=1393 RepID=A0A517IAD6_BREBE|nr:hypothetical protein [Brevibacillus brevis]QDS35847.1 hypothetical protein FPS98_18510 [Brevibacillus brevis]